MSFFRTVGATAYPLFAFLSNMDVSNGEFTTLTSSSPDSSIARIDLISNENNFIDAGDESYRSNFGTSIADAFTVKMEIFNTQCDGIETITVEVFGGEVDDDVDTSIAFSVVNSDGNTDYFSFMNDWDGGMRVRSGYTIGGVFSAPHCGSNNLFVTDDILSLLDTSNSGLGHRDALAGGDRYNWEIISSDKVGYVSPLVYTIVNDLDNNILNVSFSAPEFDQVSCQYNSAFDTFDSGNNYVFLFGTDAGHVKFDKFKVNVECEGASIYTTDVPSYPEYTETCEAYGDPHFLSWDDLDFHFQGEGYFYYVKSCKDVTSGTNYLPFKISARHDYCNKPYSCVRQVVIEVDDGNMIIFPSYGDDITPRFYPQGTSAIGTKSFMDNNQNMVEYTVSETLFEISFAFNGEETHLEVYYTHDRLRIRATDTLVVEDDDVDKSKSRTLSLCGLCGTLDREPNNELTRCDNFKVISTENVNELNKLMLPAQNGTGYENTNKFGESCCYKKLDDMFLEESDCGVATPAPIPSDEPECWEKAETMCHEVYNKYCSSCNGIKQDRLDRWINSCVLDVCAMPECRNGIIGIENGNGYELKDAISDGCLDMVVRECIATKYKAFFPRQIDFCENDVNEEKEDEESGWWVALP